MDEKRLFSIRRVKKANSKFKAIVFDSFEKQWLFFHNPVTFDRCYDYHSIHNVLAKVASYSKKGYYAVGFLSYEAAPAFDPALTAKSARDFPLAAFGIFKKPEVIRLSDFDCSHLTLGKFERSINKSKFDSDIERIKKYIQRGDTYQVNYTHRLMYQFSGKAQSFFLSLMKNMRPACTAFLEWDDYAICSMSPELFFKVDGHYIVSKPMKGTRPRGRRCPV